MERLTDLSEREASWADHETALNGDRQKYKACARILVDLAKARWTVAEDRFGIELQSPEPNYNRSLTPSQIERGKRRVRTELEPLLKQQFAAPSVRTFIAQMEQPSKTSKSKSVTLLIADGREVAQRLEPARSAGGTSERVSAVKSAIKPYLQLVIPGERDEFTNLLLGDVWRYFRYSWCIPQSPIPGRQLLYLIRDGGHPHHAVMGIASLNNCAMQNKVRDDRIGWTGEAFLTRAREVALSGRAGNAKELKSMLDYLKTQLDRALSHIETKGLCTKEDVERPTPQLVDSLRRQAGQFADFRRDALELIGKIGGVPDVLQDYESEGLPPVSDDVLSLEDMPLKHKAMTQARRMLVAKKRAAELSRLLDARLTLLHHEAAFLDPKLILASVSKEEVITAVHTALLSVKSERVGTNMLELTTCGAVRPYNPLLAGKLVALLMLSPQVGADYQRRYGREASIISSQLKNERREKDSTLVYLGTTSLFAEGSSQYERLRLPAGTISPDQPELRYESLGNTTGFGTVQFSPETVRAIENVLEHEYGYQDVNSVFGEGFSPRLRKLRTGLQMLGFEAEHLLVHHQQRRVFGVSLFSAATDFLMGKHVTLPRYLKLPHKCSEASQRIADFWLSRWLSMRMNHSPAFEMLESTKLWKLSDQIPVDEDGSDPGFDPPSPPARKPIEAPVSKVVEFWRSLATGGPEVCSDVLSEADLALLHVPQALDSFLLEKVRRGFSVVLTGNAGDGETHLLRRLDLELQRSKIDAVVQYDASAAMDHRKITPILNQWRKAQRANRPYCLAANEYPLYLLREHGRRKPADLPVLTEVDRQCRSRLSYGEPNREEQVKTTHGRVLVIDLSLRNPLHNDFAGAMFDRLLENPELALYAESEVDPNFSDNFRRLSTPPARERVLALFDRLRALGHRATVRELWIVLAQLFFGGHVELTRPVAGRFADWYSERLFAADTDLSLVKTLRRWADPASVSHPRWDLKLEQVDGTRSEDWVVDKAVPSLDRRRMGQREGRALFDAIKRRFYFEHRAGEEAFALEHGFATEFRALLKHSDGQRSQVSEMPRGGNQPLLLPGKLG